MRHQRSTEIKPTIDLLLDSSLSFARGDQYRDKDRVRRLPASTWERGVEVRDRQDLVDTRLLQRNRSITHKSIQLRGQSCQGLFGGQAG